MKKRKHLNKEKPTNKDKMRDFHIIIKKLEEMSGGDYLFIYRSVVVVNDDYYNGFLWFSSFFCFPKQNKLGNTFLLYKNLPQETIMI